MLQTRTVHKYHNRVHTAINVRLTEKNGYKLDSLRSSLRGSFDKAEVNRYVIIWGVSYACELTVFRANNNNVGNV